METWRAGVRACSILGPASARRAHKASTSTLSRPYVYLCYVCVCVCVFVCMCVYANTYVYVRTLYVCMYVYAQCMYVYIYTHAPTHARTRTRTHARARTHKDLLQHTQRRQGFAHGVTSLGLCLFRVPMPMGGFAREPGAHSTRPPLSGGAARLPPPARPRRGRPR
jgi:hypothetical protein